MWVETGGSGGMGGNTQNDTRILLKSKANQNVEGEDWCNVCTPQSELTLRNPEVGSAYRLSPQSLVSKEAQIKLWGMLQTILLG